MISRPWKSRKVWRGMGLSQATGLLASETAPGIHSGPYLAGVTIVAEVPAEGLPSFLAAGPEFAGATLNALGEGGAKAIIAKICRLRFCRTAGKNREFDLFCMERRGRIEWRPVKSRSWLRERKRFRFAARLVRWRRGGRLRRR